MALPEVGVRFVGQDAADYLATLGAAAAGETAVAAGARTAADALSGMERAAATAAQKADTLATKLDDQRREAAILAQELAQTAAAYGESSTQAQRKQLALDKLTRSINDGEKELAQLQREVVDTGQAFDKSKQHVSAWDRVMGGALERVGHIATDALAEVGQAVVQFAVDGVKAAGDFEGQMNVFASVTGDALAESGQSLDDFRDLFISLGRDLPVSTAEVQQAAIEMAKGGIEPATIAAGGLRTALDLAAAGGVGIAESAEIMAKQLGVWVDSAADATTKATFLAESADLIAQAANASTVDVSELALGLANVGGIAKVTGLSFRETVTALALMSPGFSSAADAGTSFKTFLTRLQPTTENAAQAMADLGLLTEQGTSRFYDAEGSFIGMEAAAQLLQDSLDGLSEAQKGAALQAIFGQDAYRAAAFLAEKGAKGYQDMAAAMLGAGTAAEQAARRQQGFNVALDNLMGSLEAFQITVFSAALPALTALLDLLASGVNVVTDYAQATIKGKTALAAIADIAQDVFIPAITGATAAITAYAMVQLRTMIPALWSSLPAIAAQIAAFQAQAAAVALAALPYVAIAAAIGVVTLKIQEFNEKVSDATTRLLESRSWWNESTEAITRYGAATGNTAAQLKPYADAITTLRGQIEAEIEDLGRRSAAGIVTEQQYAREMAAINAKTVELQNATAAYTAEEQAIIKETAAGLTATSVTNQVTQAAAGLGTQVSLTAEEVQKLGEALLKNAQDGQTAIAQVATTYSEFLAGVEERQAAHSETIAALEAEKQAATTEEQRKGIDERIAAENAAYAEQEQGAAAAYAAQQAAQRQHLGQMLIDYTVSQAMLGNIGKEEAAKLTAALEEEYGLQESSVASTYLRMTQTIDSFAQDANGSIDEVIGTLQEQEQQAKDTQTAMDSYAKEYVATATNNFLSNKANAEEYIRSLERIPRNISTTVTTRYTSEGKPNTAGASAYDGRASGGPVAAGTPYIVGEEGPEAVVFDRPGTVMPADVTRRAFASMAQMGAMGQQATTYNQQDMSRSLTYAPVYQNVQPNQALDAQIARAYFQ